MRFVYTFFLLHVNHLIYEKIKETTVCLMIETGKPNVISLNLIIYIYFFWKNDKRDKIKNPKLNEKDKEKAFTSYINVKIKI